MRCWSGHCHSEPTALPAARNLPLRRTAHAIGGLAAIPLLATLLAALLAGCVSTSTLREEKTPKSVTLPYADRFDRNIYLQDIPVTDAEIEQRYGNCCLNTACFAATVPIGLALDLALLPLSLLDYHQPDFLATELMLDTAFFVSSGPRTIRYIDEIPRGLRSFPLHAALMAAYAGDRQTATRLAEENLNKASPRYPARYYAPARVFLILGNEPRARECLRRYAETRDTAIVPSITDGLCWIPFLGIFVAGVAGNRYAMPDVSGLGVLARVLYDQCYDTMLDAEVMGYLEKINVFPGRQDHAELRHLWARAHNRAGDHEAALNRASELIKDLEARLADRGGKDTHDVLRYQINPLAVFFVPPPILLNGSSLSLSEATYIVQPEKYLLAAAYREKISALRALGRTQEATAALAAMARHVQGREWTSWMLYDAAVDVALGSAEPAKAAQFAQKFAQDCIDRAQFRRLLVLGLRQGEALEAAGFREDALASYLGVVTAFDSLYRHAGEDTAYSESFNREHLPFYNRIISLMVELGKPPEDILLMTERTKSRLLAQKLLAQDREASHILPEYRDSYRTLLAKWREQKRQAAVLKNEPARLRAQASAEYVRSSMLRIEQLSGEAGGRRTSVLADLSVSNLREAMAGADTVFAYWLGDDFSLAFRCDPAGQTTMTRLPPRADLRGLVQDYRAALAQPGSNPPAAEAGARLTELLLPGGAPRGRALFVPDKELALLPFEALPLAGGAYLLSEAEISYSPSLSAALGLRGATRGAPSQTLLALADPAVSTHATTVQQGLAVTFERGGVPLSPLPGTRDEAQRIAGALGGGTVLMGEEATEAAFRRQDPSRYRYVHLATHGLLGDEEAGLGEPALALATPVQPAGGEDGFLTASEVLQMVFNADLVTLSACETARGRISTGDGITSLGTSFLSAGARGVVVTTWNVHDVATAGLMEGFYRNLAAGAHPAAALREAKLAMLESGRAAAVTAPAAASGAAPPPDRSHPFFWAPFVYLGSPAP